MTCIRTSHPYGAPLAVSLRNPAAEDGLWKVVGRRQVIYAKSTMSLGDQVRAAEALIESRGCQPLKMVGRSNLGICDRRYSARTGHRLNQEVWPLAVEFGRHARVRRRSPPSC
jgi:hypothetical protein